MSEQKESSVLFSLKELMNLEEDRIKQEESIRQRQEQAEAQAKLDAERRSREEEQARLQAEEDKKRAEEQRTREEAARLAAIHQAEIEKARLAAESAARIEQLRHVQEHEIQIKTLTQDKHKKRLTLIAGATGIILVVALVGGGIFVKNQSDQQAAETARYQKEKAEAQEKFDKLNAELNDEQEHVKQAELSVQNAKDDAARAVAQQRLAEAKNQAAATKQQLNNAQPHPGGSPAPAKKPCNCPAGDPLCSCIP
jgi:colicin import membrane protein